VAVLNIYAVGNLLFARVREDAEGSAYIFNINNTASITTQHHRGK
jgi:hypothetical protein